MVTVPVNRITAQEVSHAIITASMRVHSQLGPGLLESTYTACLQHELRKAGVRSEAQVGLPVVYDGVKLDLGYRIDILVENLVIVELKSVDAISPVHQAQILSYLKLSVQSHRTSHKLQCRSFEGWHQALRKRHGLEVETINHKGHESSLRKNSRG